MALNRTSLCVALGFAFGVGLAPAPSQAQAAKYPDRPVKVVVGFTAGGGTDVAARVIAQKLSEAMGQSFVVENRPGASGLIALASPPSLDTASRIAARSTTAGTPVKSCIKTRAGRNAISLSLRRSASQSDMARISSAVTVRPSSGLSRFSSSTFSE